MDCSQLYYYISLVCKDRIRLETGDVLVEIGYLMALDPLFAGLVAELQASKHHLRDR